MQKLFFPLFVIIVVVTYIYNSKLTSYNTGHVNKQPDMTAIEAEIEKFSPARQISAFNFIDDSDGTRSIAEFRGTKILVNLWAEWCKPCVKELPELDVLRQAIPVDELIILPILVGDSSVAEINEFYQEHQIKHLPILRDKNSKIYNELSVLGLPTSILIDEEGQEYARISGYVNWQQPEIMALVK